MYIYVLNKVIHSGWRGKPYLGRTAIISIFRSNLISIKLKLKNHKNHLSIQPFVTMGKSLHPIYCHCRNLESIYCHHRPTHYTQKQTFVTAPIRK